MRDNNANNHINEQAEHQQYGEGSWMEFVTNSRQHIMIPWVPTLEETMADTGASTRDL